MSLTYVMVSAYFPRPDNRWTCAFVLDQAKAIQRITGWRVVVFNPHYDGDYCIEGVDVYGFRERASGRWLMPRAIDGLNKALFWVAIKRSGIDLHDIAVVHGHLVTSAPYVAFAKQRCPWMVSVIQFHDSDPYGMLFGDGCFGLKKKRYFSYYRRQIKYADALVAISHNVVRVLREAPNQQVFADYPPMRRAMRILRRFQPMRLPPVYVLHNGVDPALFNRSQTANREPLRRGFTIGCVALFRDLKDQITLIKAAVLLRAFIPGLILKFVGYGPHEASCRAVAEAHGLSCEFRRSVPHEELAAFYAALDLFVLPSYFEGFGCVFTEAWACGTPFITCEGQGMDDMILPEERHLWLCRPKDPEDLAKKILYFYRNRPEQHMAGSIDIDELVGRYLEFLRKLPDGGLRK